MLSARSILRIPRVLMTTTTPTRLMSSFDPRTRTPGPLPLGDKQQQREMEELIKRAQPRFDNAEELHPDAEREPLAPYPGGVNPATGEVNGPKGPEPTRYGDWERKGRVYDF
ncbi:hypothetical protein BC828DRAFT_387848 [Blastocladiella britannica]|nr:hypothetical protein BC828DRAFT_387848 [Blastocladiella britannica]